MSQSIRRVLRHVVLFAFKETATPAHVQAIERAFAALPSQIAEISGFEWGTDVSVEHLADGYTHCFLVTFASLADRDAYLIHPAHRAFVALLQPHLAKALVIDYWAGPALGSFAAASSPSSRSIVETTPDPDQLPLPGDEV